MALTLTNVSFPGEQVQQIITKVFSDAYFIKQVKPRIIYGVKGSYFKHTVTSNATLRAYQDCYTGAGTDVNLAQSGKTLCKFFDAGKISHAALESTAFQLSLKQGAQSTPLDVPDFITALVTSVMGEFGAKLDNMMLNGDTVYGDVCDGYMKIISADSAVVTAGFTPAAITASNVLSQMNLILRAARKELRYQTQPAKMLKFFVAPNVHESWLEAVSQVATSGTYDPTIAPRMLYKGVYEIVPLVNLPSNTIILTYPENFLVALDSDPSESKLVITNQELADAYCKELHWRIDSRFALDYNFGADIVLHKV